MFYNVGSYTINFGTIILFFMYKICIVGYYDNGLNVVHLSLYFLKFLTFLAIVQWNLRMFFSFA